MPEYPENIAEIAMDCGFAWPEDEAGQTRMLVLIAQTVQYWRREHDVDCRSIVRERMYQHHERRLMATYRKLSNIRKAAKEYRSRQVMDAMIELSAAKAKIERLEAECDTWKRASYGYHKSLVELHELHGKVCQLCGKLRKAAEAAGENNEETSQENTAN